MSDIGRTVYSQALQPATPGASFPRTRPHHAFCHNQSTLFTRISRSLSIMSATTSVNDEFVRRLRNACRQSIEAVRNLDGASDPQDIRILAAIGEQFTSGSSLEQAVEQELSLPVIGTFLGQTQGRLMTAQSHSAESEREKLKHALSQLDSLDSDWMAHVEASRDGIDGRAEVSIMSTVVDMLHGSVGHLPNQELQRSLRPQMEPLQAVFRPQHSLDGMPDAEAVATLMKNSRPSMAEIMEDLHINTAFAIPDGCPPLEWTRLKSAIQTMREFLDKYSGMEDKGDIIFQLTNPSIVVEVVSAIRDGSWDWS